MVCGYSWIPDADVVEISSVGAYNVVPPSCNVPPVPPHPLRPSPLPPVASPRYEIQLLFLQSVVGYGSLQVLLAPFAWLLQSGVEVAHEQHLSPFRAARWDLLHPVHCWLVIRGHIFPNDEPSLPPRRDCENYYDRPEFCHYLIFSPRLLLSDDGNPASVVALRLRRPYPCIM